MYVHTIRTPRPLISRKIAVQPKFVNRTLRPPHVSDREETTDFGRWSRNEELARYVNVQNFASVGCICFEATLLCRRKKA